MLAMCCKAAFGCVQSDCHSGDLCNYSEDAKEQSFGEARRILQVPSSLSWPWFASLLLTFLYSFLQAVEEVRAAGQSCGNALEDDNMSVAALCDKLEALLMHGLKPFALKSQNTGWSKYLPPARSTPFAMLQVTCCMS